MPSLGLAKQLTRITGCLANWNRFETAPTPHHCHRFLFHLLYFYVKIKNWEGRITQLSGWRHQRSQAWSLASPKPDLGGRWGGDWDSPNHQLSMGFIQDELWTISMPRRYTSMKSCFPFHHSYCLGLEPVLAFYGSWSPFISLSIFVSSWIGQKLRVKGRQRRTETEDTFRPDLARREELSTR